MKKLKRGLSVLLAACVFLSCTVTGASAATKVTPTVTLNPIANHNINTTVTVKGSATTPCYRMAAKYVHNGETTWLGEMLSSSYSKSFKVTSPGAYTVTLYARSYPETDSRSANGSKSVSFTVYSSKVTPSITLTAISSKKVGDTVTVKATSSTPCYQMSANYIFGGKTHWLGDVKSASYSKSFMALEPGTYTVNVFSRSYAPSDPRSDNASRSTTFTVTSASKTIGVPLYAQPDGFTCGPTSVRMVLGKYGIDKSVDEIKSYIINSLQGSYDDHSMLAMALNDLLGSKSPGYTAYLFEDARTAAEHYSLVKKNIDAGVPIIPLLGFDAESGGFPYHSDGHYVVIRGYSNTTLIINDPFTGTAGSCAGRSISNEKMKKYLEGDNPYIICAKH